MYPLTTFEAAFRDFLVPVLHEVVREEVRSALREMLPPSLLASEAGPEALDRYLSVQEAAKTVGVCANTLRSWIHEQKLPSYRAGRELRVRMNELHVFMRRGDTRAEKTPEEKIEEFMKRLAEDDATRCGTCHHLCKLHANESGACRARKCSCKRWVPR